MYCSSAVRASSSAFCSIRWANLNRVTLRSAGEIRLPGHRPRRGRPGFPRALRAPGLEAGVPYVDALALGCWAAVGAQKALLSGLSWLPSLLLGVVMAVGGGVIRDLAVGQRPSIFGGNTLYATCALLASGLAVAGSLTGHTQLCAERSNHNRVSSSAESVIGPHK